MRPLLRDRASRSRPYRSAKGPLARLPLLLSAVLALGVLLVAPSVWAAGAEEGAGSSDKPAVLALYPITFEGSEGLEYIREGLSDVLRSRLNRQPGVRVLAPHILAEALEGEAAGGSRSASATAIGRRIGADYVILGSLEEAKEEEARGEDGAGEFVLRVAVLRVADGTMAGQTLFRAQGQEDLARQAKAIAEKIAWLIDRAESPASSPPLRTSDKQEGPSQAAGTDRSAGVPAGEGAPGTPEGISVMPPADLAGDAGAGGREESLLRSRIADVQIRGNQRIESDAIRIKVEVLPGDLFSIRRVREDIKAIYRMGYFSHVTADRLDTERGIVLTYMVRENPLVRRIDYKGNENVKRDRLDDILTITTNSTLDHRLLYQNQQRIKAYYSQVGYYLADVTYRVEEIGPNAVGVSYLITENKKLHLVEVDFEGNKRFSDRTLRKLMKTKKWGLLSPVTSRLKGSGIYQEPIFYEDVNRINEYYLDRGYVRVVIEEPKIEPRADGLHITIPIHEGDRYKVGKILVKGDPFTDRKRLLKIIKLEEGKTFNRSLLTDDIERLIDIYTGLGFFYASITPLTVIDEEEKKVHLTLDIEKGQLAFVEGINIKGNTKTRDKVIRRELAVSEGELYTSGGMEYSKARVNALGYFEEVNFNTTGDGEPGLLNLDIDVVERPTGAFSIGAGFSSVDRFLFSTQIQQANLFGKGQSLSLAADIGGRRQNFNIRFTDPYFLDSPWTFGFNAFFDERQFNDFTRKGTGGGFILGYPIADYTRAFGSYNWERQKLADVDDFASALILRETERGTGVTSAVSASVVRDTRNNRLTPSAGSIQSGSLELAGLGGNNSFMRLEGRATWYFPLKSRFLPFDSVFAVNTRAGYILPFMDIDDFGVPSSGVDVGFGPGDRVPPLGSDGFLLGDIDSDLVLPVTHRYFLGGINSVRGYRARSLGPRRAIFFQQADGTYLPLDIDDSGKIDDDETNVIGGNKFFVFNLEYQFPIYRRAGLQGITFFDGGQAFAENEPWDLNAIRFAYGFGFRWFSPFGPLRFEWGFPLDRLPTEDPSVFEFSVGSPF